MEKWQKLYDEDPQKLFDKEEGIFDRDDLPNYPAVEKVKQLLLHIKSYNLLVVESLEKCPHDDRQRLLLQVIGECQRVREIAEPLKEAYTEEPYLYDDILYHLKYDPHEEKRWETVICEAKLRIIKAHLETRDSQVTELDEELMNAQHDWTERNESSREREKSSARKKARRDSPMSRDGAEENKESNDD